MMTVPNGEVPQVRSGLRQTAVDAPVRTLFKLPLPDYWHVDMQARGLAYRARQVVRTMGHLPARYERVSLNRLISILIIWAALLICATAAHGQNIEKACPLGTIVMSSPDAQTLDTTTNLYRQWLCLNLITGQVTIQPDGGGSSLPQTLTAPGVFTNTQQNDTFTVGLNSINFANEFQIGLVGFSGWNITEAMAGGCAAPSGSTVLWCTGVSGYANTSSVTTQSVGITGFSRTLIAGGKSWGGNFASTDCLAVSATTCTSNVAAGDIIGIETDTDIANSSSPGIGVNAGGTFLVQPTSALAYSMSLGAVGQWTSGFNSPLGTILPDHTFHARAFVANPISASANSESQSYYFVAESSSATPITSALDMGADANNNPLLRYAIPSESGNAAASIATLPDHAAINGLSPRGNITFATVTLSGGSGSYTFTNAYISAPICTATDTSAANPVRVTTSATAATVTGTSTDVIALSCGPQAN